MKTRLIPYVTLDGTPDEDMPSVNIDDELASYELMKTVLESGHRNICIISLGQDIFAEKATKMSLPQRRMEGFRKALKEVGIPLEDVPVLVSEPTLADGKLRGKEILAFEKMPTCVVSMSDIVAIGCIVSWNEEGLFVPNDISIAGFDNIDEASCIIPHLTTVDQPAQEKGRLAAEALFNMINKETLQSVHIQIPYTLIKRDSVKDLTSVQP